MLARTADNLFWLARYVERAEFAARIIDITARLAALPTAYGGGAEWESALSAVGSLDRFKARYEKADEASVIEFLIFDPQNPSSIRSCIASARTNARVNEALPSLLRTLLQLMSQVDNEDLVTALEALVERAGPGVAPFAAKRKTRSLVSTRNGSRLRSSASHSPRSPMSRSRSSCRGRPASSLTALSTARSSSGVQSEETKVEWSLHSCQNNSNAVCNIWPCSRRSIPSSGDSNGSASSCVRAKP